jgi:hypothetical protein
MLSAEHRLNLLGGVTVLRGALPRQTSMIKAVATQPIPVTFIPYGFWSNREPNPMFTWLQARQWTWDDSPWDDSPADPPNG